MSLRRTRRSLALVLGLALAAGVWVGLVGMFVRLHMQHRLLVGSLDSRLVDVGMLALNAVLLASFVTVHRSGRSRRPTGTERAADNDGGTPLSGPLGPDEISG